MMSYETSLEATSLVLTTPFHLKLEQVEKMSVR